MPTSPELRAAIRVLEEFKKIDPDITLPAMLAFLYAAEVEGQQGNQFTVSERLDMTGATASRSIQHWSDWKRPKVRGLGMIDSVIDPEDRRYRILTLTRKGNQFLNSIKEAVHGTKERK
jgi:DNA-binding MarR family transcriptional regulator